MSKLYRRILLIQKGSASVPDSENTQNRPLTAITALGSSEPRIETIGEVTCTEVADIALASVAAKLGAEGQAAKVLKKAVGMATPQIGGVSSKILTAFWIGPDQWMVEAPFESHEDLAAHLKPLFTGTGYVAEQTDAWSRFDLKGADVLEVLELLCNVNTRGMKTDTVSRTSIHHLGCFVRCIASDHFAIYGPRASAQSLHHAMTTAMLSVR